MAGAMRRMGVYLGLVEDDDARGYGRYDTRQAEHLERDRRYGRYADDQYDEYDGAAFAEDDLPSEELPPIREPEPLAVRRVAARPLGLAPAGAVGSAGGARISAMGSGPVGATAAKLAVREPVAVVPEPAPAAPQPYRITTLHPRTYNEARTIGERFRDGMPVIMNLTEMDDSDAKRLVDFAAGLSFGLRGSIERVTAKVFLLSPQNVDVTAEDKARIREGGFFNQS
ncbi:MAG: sepF2 [Blastococcus sp.]|jgi:cell division inhibitor SepF|nr:sepF2 [Blastococcus sp.]MCW2683646.1 sepF2 [Blastococcus sp.]